MRRDGVMRALREALVSVLVAGGLSVVAIAGAPVVSAAVTAPGGYVSVAPARLLDTRDGTGVAAAGPSPRSARSACRSPAKAACPAGVAAVALNVTVTATHRHRLHHRLGRRRHPAPRVEPQLRRRPDRPQHGHRPRRRRRQGRPLQRLRRHRRTSSPTSSATTWPAPPPTPGALHPLTPTRLLDTRNGTGATAAAAVRAAANSPCTVAGHGGVPATGASAVVLNVTVTGPTERRLHHRLGQRQPIPPPPT